MKRLSPKDKKIVALKLKIKELETALAKNNAGTEEGLKRAYTVGRNEALKMPTPEERAYFIGRLFDDLLSAFRGNK